MDPLLLTRNSTMNTTNTGNIPLSGSLSIHAKKSHIFDGMHSASLISLGQLCDDEFISILDHIEINILKDSKIILKGNRNKTYRLWNIPISITLRYRYHAIITQENSKTELINYLHVCCFRSTPRTFLKAIKW